MKWDEMKWVEMKWDEMKWDEMKWVEMKWVEIKWDEMKWDDKRALPRYLTSKMAFISTKAFQIYLPYLKMGHAILAIMHVFLKLLRPFHCHKICKLNLHITML